MHEREHLPAVILNIFWEYTRVMLYLVKLTKNNQVSPWFSKNKTFKC